MLRWNLIQTIKEETTATGFEKFFEVTGLNSKAVRRQTLYEKLHQYREMNLVAFPEEVRHYPNMRRIGELAAVPEGREPPELCQDLLEGQTVQA